MLKDNTYSRNFDQQKQLMKRVYSIFCCLYLTSLTSCGVTNSGVTVPYEFMDDNNMFLGQSMSVLKKVRNLEPDDSMPCYHEELTDNKYFHIASYNCSIEVSIKDFLGLESGELHSVDLYGSPRGDYSEIDSLALEIISICKQYFGKEFKVSGLGKYRVIEDRKPILIWMTDSCYVSFSYTPFALYQSLKKKKKYTSGVFALNIISLDKLAGERTELPSLHTKKSLGLE